MTHPTYPVVEENGDGTFTAYMVDKKRGRVWGEYTSPDRMEAIIGSRNAQPSDGKIKRMIGWVTRHPIKAGIIVGLYMMFRRPIHQVASEAIRQVGGFLGAVGLKPVEEAFRKVANKVYNPERW